MLKMRDDEFLYLVDYIKKRYGINLTQKRTLLEGRLASYMASKGYADYSAYITALHTDKTGLELDNLLNKITTNHTYFMREADHFDYFRDQVLPMLEKHVTDRDLRIWCAACATGEEAYTLAMLLEEYFGPKRQKWDTALLASDISPKALETASAGVYPLTHIKDVPPVWQSRYFAQLDASTVQIKPEIRGQVVFRRINLMDEIPAKKPYQVIFCRNVMIYFEPETKIDLIKRLHTSLCVGGFLFVGHTEAVSLPDIFRPVMPSVYVKI